MIERRRVTPAAFAPRGQVPVWSPANGQRLQAPMEEPAGATLIRATFRVDAHDISYLAQHSDLIDLFAPLIGTAVLLRALPEAPEDYAVFLLDLPVVITRGVWHRMCAHSETTILGIAENVDAGDSRRDFARPLRVGLVEGS